jgi:hypothetical protein
VLIKKHNYLTIILLKIILKENIIPLTGKKNPHLSKSLYMDIDAKKKEF